MSLAVGFIRCSMKIRRAIASAVLATSLAGCGAVDLISSGLKYARAVETDLQQATGVKPAETPPPAPIGRFLNFRILLDGWVETGIERFGPASSEGRFAIVTDVGGGMRWT
jgi:hypothetical protein